MKLLNDLLTYFFTGLFIFFGCVMIALVVQGWRRE